jgi:hypothetical protein
MVDPREARAIAFKAREHSPALAIDCDSLKSKVRVRSIGFGVLILRKLKLPDGLYGRLAVHRIDVDDECGHRVRFNKYDQPFGLNGQELDGFCIDPPPRRQALR